MQKMHLWLSAAVAVSVRILPGINRPLRAEENQSSLSVRDIFTDVRMPNIVVAPGGSVFAFADGCHLLCRSEDGGETWSQPRQVHRDRDFREGMSPKRRHGST